MKQTQPKITRDFSYFVPEPGIPISQKWIDMEYRGLRWKTPMLDPDQLLKILRTLKKNQKTYLSNLPMEKLLNQLNKIALRWLNPKDPIREKALQILPRTTGCSSETISEGLDLAFREVRSKFLKASLKNLYRFAQPKLSSFIFAGIIPTPMLFDVFLGLLLRSAVIAKSPSREPFFSVLLAKSIYEIDPKLGSCVATLWWPGGQWGLEKTIFEESDLIHAYGGDEIIQQIKVLIPPGKIFLPFGHKISFSLIGKGELQRKKSKILAHRVAYDISLYDQQGCVSPHVIYVEKNQKIHPLKWVKELALAMEKISRKFPPGQPSLGEASKIHQIRGQYLFRKKSLCLSSHPKTNWTVIYEQNPRFQPSCLNRVVFVKPLKKIEDLSKILGKWTGSFQAVGHTISQDQLKKLFKITEQLKIPMRLPLGKMQATTFRMHVEERLSLLTTAKHLDAS